MPKLSISEAAYLLGVSTDTLRRWEKEGKITSSRTEGGHRRYDLTSILKDKEDETKIRYDELCRHIKPGYQKIFTRSWIR